MKRFAIVVAAGMFIGCESAVLVNNRPERTPGMEQATPGQEETAANRINDNIADRAGSDGVNVNAAAGDSVNADRANAASDSQPSDQTVETKDIRINSPSD